MAAFELIPSPEDNGVSDDFFYGAVTTSVLLSNARWFVQIRWLVISLLFVIAGLSYIFTSPLASLGFKVPLDWMLVLSAILLVANIAFSFLLRYLHENSPANLILSHIWLQIIVDLIIVSSMIHFVGSTSTFIAFTYLFHIALSCIFLSSMASLLVTLLSASFYFSVVSAELLGIISAEKIFTYPPKPELTIAIPVLYVTSAAIIWVVMWYLLSTLARTIRQRDRQLESANKRLIQAGEERNKLVLRTTHDLKAPFAGIETNIQKLKYMFWDEVKEPMRELILRIEDRSQALRERISTILLLGFLRSDAASTEKTRSVALAPLVEEAIGEIKEQAKSREISFRLALSNEPVKTEAKQLGILLNNLVANAVSYSHDGGRVEITSGTKDGGFFISVSDQGIGVAEEKLPFIFDDYFRTDQAKQFNRSSSGLGLAIVKEVAKNLQLKIEVSSTLGQGTTFTVSSLEGQTDVSPNTKGEEQRDVKLMTI